MLISACNLMFMPDSRRQGTLIAVNKTRQLVDILNDKLAKGECAWAMHDSATHASSLHPSPCCVGGPSASVSRVCCTVRPPCAPNANAKSKGSRIPPQNA